MGLYSKTTGNLNLYGSSTTGSEPNMRDELINTLEGSFPEVAKGQPGLLRKMRRTSSGELIECACVDSVTREPDKDRFCAFCFGEGYYWDESNIEYYRVLEDSDTDNAQREKLLGPGLINVPLVVFYIRYDSEITKNDKIIELKLNNAGSAITPVERKIVYRINTAWDYRADNGKLEYWKVFAYLEVVNYLNAPSYGDF